MNALERGFLLLTCHLGNPDRKPLTSAQLRTLSERMHGMEVPAENRELLPSDLVALGYSHTMAAHICTLLEEEALLEHYLRRAEQQGCVPLTRLSSAYPRLLRHRLGGEATGCLWCKGDISLLDTPGVALVGSRELENANREFAEEVGRQAARQGLVLISGNARGADQAAQNACLRSGGQVISVVADCLADHNLRNNVLYVSEEAFDAEFSAQRAHSRNRVIHALGRVVFVAQSGLEMGGTWKGTTTNLKHGWSNVGVFRDGSPASLELEQRGAWLLEKEDLQDLRSLAEAEPNLFTRQ